MPQPNPSGVYHAYDRDPRRYKQGGERADNPDEDSYVLMKHGGSRATVVGSMQDVNEKVESLAQSGNLTAVFYWTYSRSMEGYQVQLVEVRENQLQQGKDWPQIGPVR